MEIARLNKFVVMKFMIHPQLWNSPRWQLCRSSGPEFSPIDTGVVAISVMAERISGLIMIQRLIK